MERVAHAMMQTANFYRRMWLNGANNQNCLLKIVNILLGTKEEKIRIIQIFIHNLSISHSTGFNLEGGVIWNEDSA